MSTQLFPFAVWLAGTNQNSIPANDNALRAEVIAAPAIDVADSEPGSPGDGDVHIVGTAWGAFATDDVVIYRYGNWYGFEPFEGWLKRRLDTGELLGYEGSSGWVALIQPSGGSTLVPINNQSGTSYTLAVSDEGKVVRADNAATITITVPTNGDAAIEVGASIAIRQVGAGEVVVDWDSSVTVNIPDGTEAETARQGATIMLHKVDNDEWDLTGDLAAA